MSGRNGLCERLPAWMHSDGEPPHYERLKPELLGALKGEVLEIGAGSGVNLKYYRDNVRWTGIEPNTFLHERIRQRASGLGIAMVDERWKRFFSRSPKRAGRPPSLSKIEVLTLTILARWPKWRSE